MPKSKKAPQKNEPPEDTQKLHARAYALRLAKQVGGELENSRRKAAGPKKRDGKG